MRRLDIESSRLKRSKVRRTVRIEQGAAINQLWPADTSAFDNPVWSALTAGPQQVLAQRVGNVVWFPPAIAPFVAIHSEDQVPDLEAAHARGLSAQAYFVGVLPKTLPDRWRWVSQSPILQLFPTAEAAARSEDAGVVLGEEDREAMRALTRIAFPDYFRERTAELGTYLGIYEGDTLVAMAGERLALPGWHEVSAVCTHPDHGRRGNAKRLTLAIMSRQRRRGVRTFLHVSESNAAARALYRSMDFVERTSLAHGKVERSQS